MGEVTLFPLTYVSAPSHGSRTTHPVPGKVHKTIAIFQQNISNICVYLLQYVFNISIKPHREQAASTFSLRACGAAEGAVFIFDKMAAENNVLASLGIFTANSEGG